MSSERKTKLSPGDWEVLIDRDRVQLSAGPEIRGLQSAVSAILDETASENSIVLNRRATALKIYIAPFMDDITTRGRYSEAKLKTALERLPNDPLLQTAAQKTAKFIKASERSGVDMTLRQTMFYRFVDEAVNLIKVE